jgi:hypothetical protein
VVCGAEALDVEHGYLEAEIERLAATLASAINATRPSSDNEPVARKSPSPLPKVRSPP